SHDGGAYSLHSKISELFSSFKKEDAHLIARQWFQMMETEHNETLEITDEAILAIENLIYLSNECKKNNHDLTHVWFP
ncbi:hypothetical protein, partial [Rhizobium leguminosarum]|uniref:hypothetical protein n=1 Tax=Rhizobium leguminosarum TaxID=384 RepID=UPI003F99BD2A